MFLSFFISFELLWASALGQQQQKEPKTVGYTQMANYKDKETQKHGMVGYRLLSAGFYKGEFFNLHALNKQVLLHL
jgi:hypothetical protein